MSTWNRLQLLKDSLKLRSWQRKTYYKCPRDYCHGEKRIIVSVGTRSNDRILYCPYCAIWTETRTDWNGDISSEHELAWGSDPGEWVKKYVRYHVKDWDQTIINKHARIAEVEAEIAEAEDFSTIEMVVDDWYTLAMEKNA